MRRYNKQKNRRQINKKTGDKKSKKTEQTSTKNQKSSYNIKIKTT